MGADINMLLWSANKFSEGWPTIVSFETVDQQSYSTLIITEVNNEIICVFALSNQINSVFCLFIDIYIYIFLTCIPFHF